jgi:aryl-alcohol dehydrogenase-like predicted oxidoreductase
VARAQELLRRDTVDIALLHNPTADTLGKGDATGMMKELASDGAVRAWGVSTSEHDVARAAIESGAEVLSVPFNAFRRTLVTQISQQLADKQVGLLVHSVLLYGLLAGQWTPNKEFGDGDHRAERWSPDELRTRIRQLDALRPLVSGNVTSLRAASVRYALEKESVSSAIVGPRSASQLQQLVRDAGHGPPYLPAQKLSALEQRLRNVGIPS